MFCATSNVKKHAFNPFVENNFPLLKLYRMWDEVGEKEEDDDDEDEDNDDDKDCN